MRLKLLRQRNQAAHIHGSERLAVIQRPKYNDLSPSSLDFVLHRASDEFLGDRVEVANELNERRNQIGILKLIDKRFPHIAFADML